MSLTFVKSSIFFLPSAHNRSNFIAHWLSEEIRSRICLSLQCKEISSLPDLTKEQSTDIYLQVQSTSSHLSQDLSIESYAIYAQNRSLVIESKSERGLLFGVGRFLREVSMELRQEYEVPLKQTLQISEHLLIISSPKFALRGHQIAYRPKTNTYDAFSIRQMQQEILDCVLWGCNMIEIIPHGLDDCQQSPHFQDTWLHMISQVSEFCDKIDIMVSMWYPAYFIDYSDPATMEKALTHWRQVFGSLKRFDKLFVPGGDPGGRNPILFFEIVEKQASFLRKEFFPSAEVWVSSQFGLAISSDLNLKPWNPRDYEEKFHECLNKPDVSQWLNGVVYGPWTANSIEVFRKKVPAHFPVRNYPDLCHSLKCEFPVQNWEISYAITQTRECINPRPRAFWKIMREQSIFSDGCGCYSEGVNDDVNKVIWSAFHWGVDRKGPLQNSDSLVEEILVQYGKVHMKSNISVFIKDLIYSLEQNWGEDPLESSSVRNTLEICNKIDERVSTRDYRNWRLQMLLFRGYYDVFLSFRRREEIQLEREVRNFMQKNLNQMNPTQLIEQTIGLYCNKSWENTSIVHSYRNHQWPGKEFIKQENVQLNVTLLINRLNALAASLYQGIGLQLSVPWHGGLHSERGAFFDLVWLPLSDLCFIDKNLNEIKKLANDSDKTNRIIELLSSLNRNSSIWYYSFGENSSENKINEPFLIINNVKKPFSEFRAIGEDPTFFETPIIDYADTNSTSILSLIAEGKVKRSYLSWVTIIWPTLSSIELSINFEIIKNFNSKTKKTLAITYVGKDLWVEGGDWIDFGRTVEPTRLLANGVQIHDFLDMPDTSTTFYFQLPENILESKELILKFEPKKVENITIRTPLLPIAEIFLKDG